MGGALIAPTTEFNNHGSVPAALSNPALNGTGGDAGENKVVPSFFAAMDLATAALRVWTGGAAGSYTLDFVTMATYHCCVLIWLVYLLAPETVRHSVQEVPDHNLEQWNAEMQRLLLR